jgi:hypothetical protein
MEIPVLHGAPHERHPTRAPRALHLLDIENLVGGARFSAADAAALRRRYGAVVAIGPEDLIVMATSHYAAPVAWFAWQNVRRVVRSGPDGADLALIEVLETERVAERFEEVIIASGDGIFTEPSARLQAAGCHVTIVYQPGTLSRRLAFAVRDRISLPVDRISVPARVLRRAA